MCIPRNSLDNRILGLKRAWVGAHYHSTFSNYARGVSILIRKSLPLQIMNIRTDWGGRFVIVHAVMHSKQMVLVSLYIPLPANVQLLYDIMQIVMGFDMQEVFILGDFNMVPSQDMDRLNAGNRPSSELQNWADTLALTDIWRHFHPRDREYTCHSTSYRALSRKELAYASTEALGWTREAKHLPWGIWDHAPIYIIISLAKPPGLKLWRLSRFWALDERIQESMMETICNFWVLNGESANAATLWDAFKTWIRGKYISHISSL